MYPKLFRIFDNLPGEEHDEIFDLQHEGGICTVGRVGSKGGNDFCCSSTPHLTVQNSVMNTHLDTGG